MFPIFASAATRDRLKRIEALAKKVPGHIEGALAMARASLDAREFAKARAALASYLAAPTKRIALLMAELERAERNDEGRAREWIARAVNAAPIRNGRRGAHFRLLAAGIAERPARCLRVARSADRHRQPGAGDRPGACCNRRGRRSTGRCGERAEKRERTRGAGNAGASRETGYTGCGRTCRRAARIRSSAHSREKPDR